MAEDHIQYIFPELERRLFITTVYIIIPLLLFFHGVVFVASVASCDRDGMWISLVFGAVFLCIFLFNIRYRKYCLAKWAFDGAAFHVYMMDAHQTVEISQTFCVSVMMLSFSRRYSLVKYPFIAVLKPGTHAPYEEMNGYSALKKRDAVIIPLDADSLGIFSDCLRISNIPHWPKSGVYGGIAGVRNIDKG